MDSSTASAIDNIYKETKNFLIIGLTGRTGSGCTTAAKILSSDEINVPGEGYEGLTENELKKHRIIKRYIDGSGWQPFYRVEVSCVITYHLSILSVRAFSTYLTNFFPDFSRQEIVEASRVFHAVRKKVIKLNLSYGVLAQSQVLDWFDLYLKELPVITDKLRVVLGGANFTRLYQKTGDNIRASARADVSGFIAGEIFNFPKHINFIIKVVRAKTKLEGLPCRIVIDAIRSPYEAFFLKRRYANFYLFSINTTDVERRRSLREFRKFSIEVIAEIDAKEYPSKLSGAERFIAQNMQECIENSDVHIHNSKGSEFNHNDLVSQLAWYVTLMARPGIIMPTSLENCMQIAYTAKQNSGCISRQVGAVVTDESYSIKSVGWNSTPQGQTPCILRSAEDLLLGLNKDDYSDYEQKDPKFRAALSNKFSKIIAKSGQGDRNLSFCFKGIQNEIEGEKNQVHTRSLHAEENAFMQISKHGGQKLAGGVLFTTASPCELCAKKAYQLGLKKIVYIDPYPGIATDHILSAGSRRPELELFRGAVGRAFYQLYQPLMPYKDEVELVFDLGVYHDPKRPSKNFLLDENFKLSERNEFLEGELVRLNTILSGGSLL